MPKPPKHDDVEEEEDLDWVIAEASDVADRIAKFIATADFFAKALEKAPRTVSQWSAKMEAALKAPPCPHVGRGRRYMRMWHVRCYMLCRMHAQGIAKLSVDQSCTLNSLVYLNPDMSGGLKRIRSHFQNQGLQLTTKQFIQHLGAKRPELLSMWSCFAIDPGFQMSEFTSFNAEQWHAAADRMLKETKVPPHLAVPGFAPVAVKPHASKIFLIK